MGTSLKAQVEPSDSAPGVAAWDPKAAAKLRWGFSTGTAATAAALAAASLAVSGKAPDRIEPTLPGGSKLGIDLIEASGRPGRPCRCAVVKDAGDDPDVTNGALISASVEIVKAPGLILAGGAGVGLVTKPGLVVKVGQWAINPSPRRMLADNLSEVLASLEGSGLKVTIEIAGGEALALKTLNPRLGIIGGLSILGTTGLVKPFSHGAYVGAIDSAFRVARAAKCQEIVLTTGVRSEALARADRPDLPETAFVQIADFFRSGIKLAVHHHFSAIGLAVFFGKAVKQAQGTPYTHAHHGDLTLEPLAECVRDFWAETERLFVSAPTAMAALEVLRARGALGAVPLVAGKVLAAARAFAGPGPNLWVRIYDFDGPLLALAEG
ncbi:MAG: cobalt-precorrin-5B (C(1))-methyltransferase CbiD [Deltaproteobacteria bacterium]|jgi:cobalt-precorrin-5B (C1)-methyltransferase|nr:cobalt-precorrin-5B (C(1))-methyltransferase CbiD [Deltaproteobacteria bacterium]